MSKDEARCFTIVVVEKRAIPSTNETRKSPPLPCSAIGNESINLSAGSSRDYRLLEIHFSIESFQLFLASLVHSSDEWSGGRRNDKEEPWNVGKKDRNRGRYRSRPWPRKGVLCRDVA